MTNTYLILTKAVYEGKLPSKLKTADRLSWETYTYKDVEKTATRSVDKYDYYPSSDKLFAWGCHLAAGQFHDSELRTGKARAYLEEQWT